MKVLYMTNIPSPYRVDFFNELGKYCDLTVLFESKYAKSRHKEWKSNKVNNFTSVFLKGISIGEAEAFCPSIVSYLSKEKYDIIIVGFYSSLTAMFAIEYMRFKKIPFILNSDGGIIKKDSKFKKKIKKHFISSATMWLSTGIETNKYLLHYGAQYDKIYVYPFTSIYKKEILSEPISLEEKRYLRKDLGLIENKIVISVGQFIPRKGYDILLNNCKSLDKSIGIYIIGGNATNEYIDLKKKLNLENIHFINFMNKEQLSKYYKAADLFILPTREDIWGLVINEAIAHGLPVITTNKCIAGLELVKSNGKIIDVFSDWGHEINRFFNKIEQNEMQLKSLQIAQNYSIENMVESHLNVFYDFMIGEKK